MVCNQGKDPIRIGLVTSLIDNIVKLNSSANLSPASCQSHVLMQVNWYGNHARSDYDSSIILTATVFENDSCSSHLAIICQCAILSPITLQFDW